MPPKPALVLPADLLRSWCRSNLGSAPVATLFKAEHLSSVVGLRLEDGRTVVVKARAESERLLACTEVQRHLWQQGYPCPQPLNGPVKVEGMMLSAEVYVQGGAILESGPDFVTKSAAALAKVVAMAPSASSVGSLQPPSQWVWSGYDRSGLWPPADDLDDDLNSSAEPAWLDDACERARRRLRGFDRDIVIGHGDWEAQNLRWLGQDLLVVHDWDSVVSMPEAMLAGTAAAVFTATGAQATDATVEESAAFLLAYQASRGLRWDEAEQQVFWAAGLFTRAFNAKKATFSGQDLTVLRLRDEAEQRLKLAGA